MLFYIAEPDIRLTQHQSMFHASISYFHAPVVLGTWITIVLVRLWREPHRFGVNVRNPLLCATPSLGCSVARRRGSCRADPWRPHSQHAKSEQYGELQAATDDNDNTGDHHP